MTLFHNWGSLLGVCALCINAETTPLRAEEPDQDIARWKALAMIESGNNDHAVGAVGEISRYQIRPAIWQRYAPPHTSWKNPQTALAVATKVMDDRLASFRRTHQRPPTDFEFYVLWNAPGQIRKPTRVVTARAHRYCGLVSSEQQRLQLAQLIKSKPAQPILLADNPK